MSNPPTDQRIAILPEDWYPPRYPNKVNVNRYNTDDTIIFSSFGGSSWHRADANFIFWVNTLTFQVRALC